MPKAEYLRNILKISEKNVYIHCDSLVSLYWVKHDPDKLKIYVSNRVRKIRELATIYDINNKKTHSTHFQIVYVPGLINPADYVSKVTAPEKYVNNENWTMGPKFLTNDNEQILEEFAVDKISENTKGNISENILEKIEEKEKFMAEEEIKRIKIKSNLQRIKTNENKLVELLDKYSTGNLLN